MRGATVHPSRQVAGAAVAVWVTSVASLVGCVPIDEAVPDRQDVFAQLHEGQLAEFAHRLELDEHAGRDDAYTDVGRALVRLATCRPVDEQPPERVAENPQARLMWELIQLEERRRLRLVHQYLDIEHPPWHRETIHDSLTAPGAFELEARSRDDDELIRWPDQGEGWPDEWPAPRDLEHFCDDLHEQHRRGEPREPFDQIDEHAVTAYLVDEWLQTRRVDRAVDALERGSALRGYAERMLAVHRGDLAMRLRGREEALVDAEQGVTQTSDAALQELLEHHERYDRPPAGLSIRAAALAMERENRQAGLAALRQLLEHPHDAVADTARYHATRLAWLQGDWETAADLGSEPIEGPERLVAAYAYFAATANRHAGRDDEFLGIARDALRDRRRDEQDPFAGALYREVLRELARYDVDERTVELLEEFGPRAQLEIRKREFAEVALDQGRPGVAEQLVEPLLERTRDARQLPRLHATLALAAFMRDDRDTFDAHVKELIERPDQLRRAIPRGRRAAFFAHRDTELARVLRATVALMAQWGDDHHARAMRQRWLETLVEHTRTFLRNTPESAVSDDLAELYRLAGQLLEDHPRGYAERVGEQEPSASALVLGTVNMPPTPPMDEAPHPELRWPPIRSLLLIPKAGVPPEAYTREPGADTEVQR